MIHKCDICNYTTERNQYFLKHIETEKHKVNIKNLKKVIQLILSLERL